MANDITTLNANFKAFMDFAQAKVDADAKGTVVRGTIENGALSGRTITASTTDSVKGLFHWRRSDADKAANDATRAMFRQAVIDMFGGETKIPKKVRDAMILSDYGSGKPLTARRITAVANAIRELGLANAFEAEGTQPGEMKRLAEAAGYTEKDFGRLNRAANLYAQAFGGTLKDALALVLDKKSEVNAAMEAGELYMKDADSFRNGVLKHSEANAVFATNNAIVAETVRTGDVKGYAQIAKNIAKQLRGLLDEPAALLAKHGDVDGGADPLASARQVVNKSAAHFETIAQRIMSGEIADERQAAQSVIKAMQFTQATAAIQTAVNKMTKKHPELRDVKESMNNVIARAAVQKDTLYDAFLDALTKRELPKVMDKIAQTGAKVPQQVLDNLKQYMREGFRALEQIENFCAKLTKNGDASLHFTDDQKAQLKTMLKGVMDEVQAEKALTRIVDEFETALFTECLKRDDEQIVDGKPRTTQIIEHFQRHPEALKALNLTFNMEKIDDVKAELKTIMTNDITKGLAQHDNNVTTFTNGLYPQAIREYNPGYVTFNGGEIHGARTGQKFYGAQNNSQNGYAEFLHETFPEGQVKMRETVSYICGMANGLGGAIDGMFANGPKDDPTLIKGLPRMKGMEHNTFFTSRNRTEGENYDISRDEQGNVTIKMTHIAQSTLVTLMPDDVSTASVNLNKMDQQGPIVAKTKFVVTVKIPFASDADLGDAMPPFEITDFSQEPL